MNLYALKEYLRYRMKARGRHGIHSPYIYALAEQCLMRQDNQSLEQKLTYWFNSTRAAWFDDPAELGPAALKQLSNGKEAIIVGGIHKSPSNSALWEQLKAAPGVNASIDLFEYGLLLFNADFKVKQHFILKYSH